MTPAEAVALRQILDLAAQAISAARDALDEAHPPQPAPPPPLLRLIEERRAA